MLPLTAVPFFMLLQQVQGNKVERYCLKLLISACLCQFRKVSLQDREACTPLHFIEPVFGRCQRLVVKAAALFLHLLPAQQQTAVVSHQNLTRMATTLPAQQHDDLVAATIHRWPDDSADARAKRAAALYLLSCPAFGAKSSPIATAVQHELGATTQQCGLRPFRQLLQQDVCFNVRNAWESEAWIVLRPKRCA